MKIGFIVEGVRDKDIVLKAFPDSVVILLRGTRINRYFLLSIEIQLMNDVKLYILTDPDETGELMAQRILSYYPDMKQIIVPLDQAKCLIRGKWKYGIEYMKLDDLKAIVKAQI